MTRNVILKVAGAALILSSAVILSSCGTTFMVAADDMYGNYPSREKEKLMAPPASSATSYAADTFNYDDYYDYEYTSRLRRFHNDEYVSNDYYSDYYTNSYWYDRDPYYYGTSIYLGYNWCSPSYYYRPSWYYDWRWGWNNYWGYSPYYSWYYTPYYSWGGYWGGYNHGYWDGYWDGRYDHRHYHPHDYCYNAYDRNTFHHAEYGRRIGGGSSITRPVSVAGGNHPAPRTGATAGTARPTFAQKYETAMASSSNSASHRVGSTGNTGLGMATLDSKPRINNDHPSGRMESVSNRLSSKPAVRVNPVAPAVRNNSGNNNNVNTSAPVRTSAPASSAPARVNPAPSGNGSSGGGSNRTGTGSAAPVRSPQAVSNHGSQPRQYSTPVYTNNHGSASYSRPASGSSSSASRPSSTSRSYSSASPARSTSGSSAARPASSAPRTYSAPSRPSGGSSASRSSGGSSGSRSSGSSSSSSRR